MSDSQKWYETAWVLALLSVFSVVGLSFSLPLFDLDEGAFTEATREMLLSGNWTSTTLNGEPRTDKPILIYWLQGVSAYLFGFTEGSLRFPSLVMAGVWVFITFRFVSEFMNRSIAVFAIIAMTTSWLMTIIFKAAIADALLNALICWTIFSMYRYLQEPSTLRLVGCGVAMGLGFLTKGPVAVVLPLGAFVIAMSLMGRAREFFAICARPAAWVSLFVVITPWHVASYLDQGWVFFEGFYLGHNLGRFNETMTGYTGNYFYYFLLFPLLLLPFSRWLPGLAESAARALSGRDELLSVLLWSWFVLTFVIFTLSSTQLPHYLLYGMTPIYILLGQAIYRRPDIGCLWVAPGALFALYLVAAPYAVLGLDDSNAYLLATFEAGVEYASSHATIHTMLGAGLFLWLLWMTRRSALEGVIASSVSIVVVMNLVVIPTLGYARQAPAKQAAAFASAAYPDHDYVAWQINMPSFSVYTERTVPSTDPNTGSLVFTRIDQLESLTATVPFPVKEPVFVQGGIALVVIE